MGRVWLSVYVGNVHQGEKRKKKKRVALTHYTYRFPPPRLSPFLVQRGRAWRIQHRSANKQNNSTSALCVYM